jgi:hypothetical protein
MWHISTRGNIMKIYFPYNSGTRGKGNHADSFSCFEKALRDDRLSDELASTQLRYLLGKQQINHAIRELIMEGQY